MSRRGHGHCQRSNAHHRIGSLAGRRSSASDSPESCLIEKRLMFWYESVVCFLGADE
jgi:hypothetical protein